MTKIGNNVDINIPDIKSDILLFWYTKYKDDKIINIQDEINNLLIR